MRHGPSTRPRRSSRPQRRERAWKSPLTGSCPCVATRDLIALFLDGIPRMIGLDAERERSAQRGHSSRGSHAPQGDGSAVTGRRATGDFVQAPVCMEGLDLMDDPLRELEHLRAKSALRHGVTGELGAATSCPPSSEGAGRRRTPAMEQRAVLRPYLHRSIYRAL
jgi:hypothetical protein